MNVLITGGAGFIGSHLSEYFINTGQKVTIVDNLSFGSMKNIIDLKGKIELQNGDIRDINLIEALTKKSDLIIHLAAVLGVDNILNNPINAISNNYFGSEVVMNAALKFNKRIVIASTSEIYGKNDKKILSETDDRVVGPPQKLRWSYADSKALEESVAHFLYLKSNLKVTTIRFFNTVGPRQTGKYGMVIPRFVKSALNNDPIYVYGDGLQKRVFCHVTDTVEALYLLTQTDASIGEVYNIGGVREISILELANLVKTKTNAQSEIFFKSYRDAYSDGFEDMQRRVPDIRKISSLTGWYPKLDLDNVIDDVIAFEKTNL
jgi:UDP-glucose 4-epimerase